MRVSIIAVIVGLTLFACYEGQSEPQDDAEFLKVSAAYEEASGNLIQSLDYIKQPLGTLDREQRAAVAALVMMTRVAAQQQSLGAKDSTLIDKMWVEIPDFCPPIPEVSMNLFGDCRDQEMAYATSMARCLEDGDKSEADCEKESYGDLTAAVMCRMQEIEALAGVIREIPGRDWPPSPIPWPE